MPFSPAPESLLNEFHFENEKPDNLEFFCMQEGGLNKGSEKHRYKPIRELQ